MSAFYDLSKTPRNILNQAIVRAIVSENNGALFDPSDLSTLFQDAAGTIPVTAVEQPVGLMLDKSRGLMLGPELVSNGTFDSSSAWVVAGGWAISVGAATNTAGVGANLTQSNIVVAKKFYQLTYTVTVIAGGLAPNIGGTDGISRTTSGTRTEIIVAGTLHSDLRFWASSSFSGSIDNISVKELYGYHATQPITASRPTLSARYNLLTKTEDFSDAEWIKSETTVSNNKIIPSTASSSHYAYQQSALTIPAGAIVSFDTNLKHGGYGFVRIQLESSSGLVFAACRYNLSTGAIVQSDKDVALNGATNVAAQITQYPDGFFRCHLECVIPTTTTVRANIRIVTSASNFSFSGDGVSGAISMAADLRIGTTNGPYQRVNTATDYDTDERYFKKYLRFDGVDDYLNLPYMGLYAGGSASVVMGASIPAIPSDAYVLTEANTGYPDTRYGLVRVSAATHSISSLVRTDGGSTLASTLGLVVPSEVSVVTSIVDTGTSIRYGCGQEALNIPYNRTGTVSLNTTTVGAVVSTATIGILKTNIYSLIITKSALTDSQRVACERYLGRKSGVQL